MEGQGKNTCGNCNNRGNCHTCSYCGCFHHKIVPTLVTLIALVFLLRAFDAVSADFVAVSWPILLGLAGITKLFVGRCRCYSK